MMTEAAARERAKEILRNAVNAYLYAPPGPRSIPLLEKAHEAIAATLLRVRDETVEEDWTGEQWSAARSEFVKYATRYANASVEDANIIADVAGNAIRKAAIRSLAAKGGAP